MTSSTPAHYATLGVSPSITPQELAKHYRRLSLELHPDRAAYRNCSSDEEAQHQARFQRITEAYRVLADPTRRMAYDTQNGVNFAGRRAALQEAIRTHNVGLCAEPLEGTARKRSRSPPCDSLPEDDDEEDEDDYIPESGTQSTLPTLTELLLSGTAIPAAVLARSFSLIPTRDLAASSEVQLRGVELHRADDLRWGLTLQPPNCLISSHQAGIPFPSQVVQLNLCGISEDENITDRFAQLPMNQNHVDAVLSFGAQRWELVGETARLVDVAVREALVPMEQVAALIPALLPDVAILRVNTEDVSCAEELRAALARCGERIVGERSKEDGTTKPEATEQRSIVLEVATLPLSPV